MFIVSYLLWVEKRLKGLLLQNVIPAPPRVGLNKGSMLSEAKSCVAHQRQRQLPLRERGIVPHRGQQHMPPPCFNLFLKFK